MVKLRRGDRRWAVRFLQRALNARSKPRGLPFITVDGVLGDETLRAVQRVGRALGALESTLAVARRDQAVSIGLQRMIRWPALRNPKQLQRARDRREAAAARDRGPRAALSWARQWIGRTEQPPGSNRGDWGLTQWQRDLGAWLIGAPWCGVFVGTALKRAGVKGISYRVAAVRYIWDDAGAGRNGWLKRVGTRSAQPGDAVILFGFSTHVELVEKRVPGGYICIGGNTSSSNRGSQSNGGGVYRRTRPYSAVVGACRPRY